MSISVNQVRDYMTPSVLSVTEETPLTEVLLTLQAKDVSCLVVTRASGEPVGVVSLSDLMRVSQLVDGRRGDPLQILPPELCAKDVMNTPLVTIDDDAMVSEAASKMLTEKIHRVFVRRNERLVGVFSTRDAMRVVMFRHLETPLRELMTTPVATVAIGDSIAESIAKLDRANVRGLVVVDGTTPVGLFTQFEAIRARALSEDLRKNPVEEVMSYETISLDLETPIHRAAGHALAMRVRRIIAVEGRALRGVLTGYDIAKVLV
jgi:CBS domain-containing protein